MPDIILLCPSVHTCTLAFPGICSAANHSPLHNVTVLTWQKMAIKEKHAMFVFSFAWIARSLGAVEARLVTGKWDVYRA